VANDDERIALFLDYENLAIGARDGLGVSSFDFGPVADALAERGRVVVRRAYADWSYFDADRRLLARAQVELIEIPQLIGASRKNAADIKMAVDAIELAYERRRRPWQASGAPPQLSGLKTSCASASPIQREALRLQQFPVFHQGGPRA
jgi:hypothetical protein